MILQMYGMIFEHGSWKMKLLLKVQTLSKGGNIVKTLRCMCQYNQQGCMPPLRLLGFIPPCYRMASLCLICTTILILRILRASLTPINPVLDSRSDPYVASHPSG